MVVYHGTYDRALNAPISLARCRPDTDFGQGFYTTTHLHQAKQWANEKVRGILASNPSATAAVYVFQLDRNSLANLDCLVFPRAIADYWEFVAHCRAGAPIDHARWPPPKPDPIYDIVVGPVTLWPQSLIINDCDQISFHTAKACGLLHAKSQIGRPAGRYYR